MSRILIRIFFAFGFALILGACNTSDDDKIDILKAKCEVFANAKQNDSLAKYSKQYIEMSTPGSREQCDAENLYARSLFIDKQYGEVLEMLHRMPQHNNFKDIACRNQFLKARTLQRMERFDESIAAFKLCFNYNSSDDIERDIIRKISIDALVQLMNTYQSAAKTGECITYFKWLKSNPTPILQRYCRRDISSVLAYAYSRADSVQQSENEIDATLKMRLVKSSPERLFRDYSYAAAIYYGNTAKQEQVIAWCKAAIQEARKANNKSGVQWTTSMLASMYRKTGRIDEAVEMYKSSIEAAKELKDVVGEANAYGELAYLYIYWHLYKQANEYATLSLQNILKHKEPNPSLIGNAYIAKAKVMNEMNRGDSAVYYWTQAELSYQSLPYNRGLGDVDCQLGAFLVTKSSGDSLKRGMAHLHNVVTKGDTKYIKANAYYQLAQGYLKLNNHKSVNTALDSMYAILKSSPEPLYIDGAYRFALDYYLSVNDDKHAMQYSKEYMKEVDLKFDDNISRKVTEAMIQYQTEKKEQQLKLAQAELSNKDLKIRMYILLSLALIIMLALSIGWAMYKRRLYKLKKTLDQQTISNMIECLHDARQDSKKMEDRLNELLSDVDSFQKIKSVSPEMLKTSGESKFRQRFAQLYPSFLPKLKDTIPNITRNEELLSMLIVMGQNTDQIAEIVCIERQSVNMARHRLRQKMQLNKEDSLDDFLKTLIR